MFSYYHSHCPSAPPFYIPCGTTWLLLNTDKYNFRRSLTQLPSRTLYISKIHKNHYNFPVKFVIKASISPLGYFLICSSDPRKVLNHHIFGTNCVNKVVRLSSGPCDKNAVTSFAYTFHVTTKPGNINFATNLVLQYNTNEHILSPSQVSG